MWYVMQVRTGSEENIQFQCQRNIPEDILGNCFIPYYEEKKHTQGEWKICRKVLFPGYVFLDSQELTQLYMDLKQISGLTKLLRTGDEIIALTKEEVGFLQSFGGKEQVVIMSEGIIENSKIIVTSGPLVGKEEFIKRIDRHKRKAYLEMEIFGRMQRVQVGLEIAAKT